MSEKIKEREFFRFADDFSNTLLIAGLTCTLVWLTLWQPQVGLGAMFVGGVLKAFVKLTKKFEAKEKAKAQSTLTEV